MTAERALELVKKKVPERKPEGFWKIGNEFVFKLSSQYGSRSLEPPLFAVTPSGTVYPTNPVRHEVDVETMTKI